MAYGSAFGIRKILICGAGICYLVILRGEGGIAKKVTALWFILFGSERFPVLQRERTRDRLMLMALEAASIEYIRKETSGNDVSNVVYSGLNKHWIS